MTYNPDFDFGAIYIYRLKDEFPEAYRTLREDRYVDDILSGADSMERREIQISAVQEVLKQGGNSL